MKKTVLIILLSAISLASFSQIRLGIAGGTELAWLSSNSGNIKSNGTVMGFNFGLLTDYFFAERYSLSSGIFINNTGGKLQYADSLNLNTADGLIFIKEQSNVRYRLQYLDIPFAFHMESNQIGYFVYHAQFGITNHINIGANAQIEQLDNKKIGCKDEINFYSMGYNIGGGLDYYFSKNTAITLSLIFNSSFIDITKSKNEKTKLNSVALRLGFIF